LPVRGQIVLQLLVTQINLSSVIHESYSEQRDRTGCSLFNVSTSQVAASIAKTPAENVVRITAPIVPVSLSGQSKNVRIDRNNRFFTKSTCTDFVANFRETRLVGYLETQEDVLIWTKIERIESGCFGIVRSFVL
jgi:hypothetical protein